MEYGGKHSEMVDSARVASKNARICILTQNSSAVTET
jgi:hypothetical protein